MRIINPLKATSSICILFLLYTCDKNNIQNNSFIDENEIKQSINRYAYKIDEIFDITLTCRPLIIDVKLIAEEHINSRYFFNRLINRLELLDSLNEDYFDFKIAELQSCISKYNNCIDSLNLNENLKIYTESLTIENFEYHKKRLEIRLYQIKIDAFLIHLKKLTVSLTKLVHQ